MGRDPNQPYRGLIDHPVQQIDRFLLQFDLEDEWAGITGGPVFDEQTGEVCLEYNLRILDGPYDGQYCADLAYRFDAAKVEDLAAVKEVYRQQVDAIETAFPDATVACYQDDRWAVER